MACKTYQTIANFRLLTSLALRSLSYESNGTNVILSTPHAPEIITYLADYSLDLDVFTLTEASVISSTTTSITASIAVPPTSGPTPLSIIDNLTGQPTYYSIQQLYYASVDEMVAIRLGRGLGLEITQIDLEGRWLGPCPLLIQDNRYDAALLVDGGVWNNGTFKHSPRVRSRFGLEVFFGQPLLGVFSTVAKMEPGNQSVIDSDFQVAQPGYSYPLL